MMKKAAKEFLEAWVLQQDHREPLSDVDAAMIADQWESDALQNGISTKELLAAAGGSVASYLQRTFGRKGSELALD